MPDLLICAAALLVLAYLAWVEWRERQRERDAALFTRLLREEMADPYWESTFAYLWEDGDGWAEQFQKEK